MKAKSDEELRLLEPTLGGELGRVLGGEAGKFLFLCTANCTKILSNLGLYCQNQQEF